MKLFKCPNCAATYAIIRRPHPSEREPSCEECDCPFPDGDADEWLHYRRAEALVALVTE
jgi:hypothetical protein